MTDTYGTYLRACLDGDVGYMRSVRHLLIDERSESSLSLVLYDAAAYGSPDVFYYILTSTKEIRKDITGRTIGTLFTLLLNDNRIRQCEMVADIMMDESYIPWLRASMDRAYPDSRGFIIYSLIIDRLSKK